MVNRRKCKRCGEKLNKRYKFCPNCGIRLIDNQEDWGMLGKTDKIEEEIIQNPFFDGIGGGILNKMLGNAMKMLEKEMKKVENPQRTNFKLMINGKEINFNNKQEKEPIKIQENLRREFTQDQLKRFLKLPKEEPKTKLKRLGDRIIYEIEISEVKSFDDILINKLENSIEIKAIGKTRAYSKIIPINIPIINKNLKQGKLILELKENN